MKNSENVFNSAGILGVVDVGNKGSARNLVRLQALQEKVLAGWVHRRSIQHSEL